MSLKRNSRVSALQETECISARYSGCCSSPGGGWLQRTTVCHKLVVKGSTEGKWQKLPSMVSSTIRCMSTHAAGTSRNNSRRLCCLCYCVTQTPLKPWRLNQSVNIWRASLFLLAYRFNELRLPFALKLTSSTSVQRFLAERSYDRGQRAWDETERWGLQLDGVGSSRRPYDSNTQSCGVSHC